MGTQLELRLLGGFEVRRGTRPLGGFESRKVRALLAYLALARGRAIPRDRLAGLFWPDHDEASAHQSLRQALYNLHEALGDRERRLVACVAEEVIVPTKAPLWIDAEELVAATQTTRNGAGASRLLLESVPRLYRGDLLAGLELGCEAFHEWLEAERERLRELTIGAVRALLALYHAAGDLEAGIPCARRLLELDPLDEEAHQQLMRFLALSGRRATALAQFELLRRRLDDDLGVQPSTASQQLVRAIQRGDVGNSSPATGAVPRELFVPLVGRQEALRQLAAAWQAVRRGPARLTLIEGEPGVGKTRLVKTFLAAQGRSEELLVLVGRARTTHGEGRFAPLVEALASLPPEEVAHEPGASALAALACQLPPLCALRSDLPCPSPPPAPTLAQAARATAGCLRELSACPGAPQRPVVVLLDDVDRASRGLAELVTSLLTALGSAPVWLIATRAAISPARSPKLDALAAVADEIVSLTRLRRDEIVELCRAVVRGPQALELGELLWSASNGLPLGLVEGIDLLCDEEALRPAAEAGWEVTGEVASHLAAVDPEALLLRRVGCLPAVSRRLLTLAAVIGDRFPVDLLEAAEGEDSRVVAAGLEILIERRFVRPWLATWRSDGRERDRALWAQGERRGVFELEQPLLRDAVYRRLPAARRRALHLAVGGALERLGAGSSPLALAALAHHLAMAQAWARALPWIQRAQARAVATGDLEAAQRYAERAQLAADQLGQRP